MAVLLKHPGHPPLRALSGLETAVHRRATDASLPWSCGGPRKVIARLVSSSTAAGSRGTRQNRLPAAYYRGGTSRAVFFDRRHLPADRSRWPAIFRGVVGSPDPDNGRQLDGLGGGISSLSKVCVISMPSSRPDAADVDYTFAAIGVRDDGVDFSSNCGNMTAAVGPAAVDLGLVSVPLPLSLKQRQQERRRGQGSDFGNGDGDGDGEDGAESLFYHTVRIHNTNSGKVIHSTFPVVANHRDGTVEACAYGDFEMDGVAGRGPRIKLDFIRPAGSRTGKLLPTGSSSDLLTLELSSTTKTTGKELRQVEVSCVDVGNPCVFVRAQALDVPGTITPDEIDSHPTLLADLETIRRACAVEMGLAGTVDDPEMPASVPKIAMVSSPAPPEEEAAGRGVDVEVDIVARALSVGQPHRAIPITVALALAAACDVAGSVPEGVVVRKQGKEKAKEEGGSNDRIITVGHASGKVAVSAEYSGSSGGDDDNDDDGEGSSSSSAAVPQLEKSSVFRSARRIMQGEVFWK